MKTQVTSLDSKATGDIELADEIFGLEVRNDLIADEAGQRAAANYLGESLERALASIGD